MTKISVIIPVYNVEKYLKQCLNSLINQTLRDIEIICVDDGSTDGSVEIIEKFAKKDSRVSLIRQKNSYAGVARNNGLKSAVGKYVIFLDSDDFFDSDMLLSMYEKAESEGAEICLCGAKNFNEKTGEYSFPIHYLNTNYLPQSTPFSAKDMSKRIFNAISPAPWSKLFRRDFVLKNKLQFQPLKKTNDLLFVYTALVCAEKITYIDAPFVSYRVENGSSLQGTTAELSTDFYSALFALKKALQRRHLFTRYEQSFANRALSTCLYALNRVSNKENYFKVAEMLRNSYLYNLSVLGHSRGYFYNKSDYDKLINLLETDVEELWKANEASFEANPAVDLNAWVSPVEIPCDGSVRVSVIIPVYNVEKYLEECVESVINNTLRDIEIICVDDGSTDGSAKIIERFAEKDSRVKVISKENGGLSSARNAGMKKATGEYILFLDSDDYIEPRALEYLYAEAKAENLDQLFFGAKSFYDNADVSGDFHNYSSYYTRKANYSYVMTGRTMFNIMSENAEFKPSACLQLVRKGFLDENEILFVEGLVYEDNPFTLECLFLSKRVMYKNINLYNRRLRKNSIITASSGIRSSYNYYCVIKAVAKLAVKYNFAADLEFYNAFLLQLERFYKVSRRFVNDVSLEELLDFICSLPEQEGIEYYILLSREYSATGQARRQNAAQEKALMDRHKERCRRLNDNSERPNEVKRSRSRLKNKLRRIIKTVIEKLLGY